MFKGGGRHLLYDASRLVKNVVKSTIFYCITNIPLLDKIILGIAVTLGLFHGIINQIALLPISNSGISDKGIPFIELDNNLLFYGYPPSAYQTCLYGFLEGRIREKVPPPVFGVAYDVAVSFYRAVDNDGDYKQRYYEAKEGDVAVELGAYIGYYTMKLARKVGKDGQVIAIEPVERNLKLLMMKS